jgi:hypothetical protein
VTGLHPRIQTRKRRSLVVLHVRSAASMPGVLPGHEIGAAYERAEERSEMTKTAFVVIGAVAWGAFFVNVGQAWSFPWDWILMLLGGVALILTVGVVEGDSKCTVVAPPTRLAFITIVGTWAVFLYWINPHLSPYWSLIVPLVAIVAAYGIFMLWPDPKPEEKPEDLLAAEDSHRGE